MNLLFLTLLAGPRLCQQAIPAPGCSQAGLPMSPVGRAVLAPGEGRGQATPGRDRSSTGRVTGCPYRVVDITLLKSQAGALHSDAPGQGHVHQLGNNNKMRI